MSVLPAFLGVHPMHTWFLWSPEEGVQSLETGVSAAYGLPSVGARNQTYVLYKSSKYS